MTSKSKRQYIKLYLITLTALVVGSFVIFQHQNTPSGSNSERYAPHRGSNNSSHKI
ncbi:MAG: hypothetical protein ACRC1Z_19495 [Waterburya sp.]